MISSPILLVGRSRSGDSCTYFSTALTILSNFAGGIGRFSQARRSPAITLFRSKVSRVWSFLVTMYGIWSIRSYEVKRRSHFRHSRRLRIESPSRDSRESTTLSSIKPQKGHFIVFAPHYSYLVLSMVTRPRPGPPSRLPRRARPTARKSERADE